MFEFRFIEPAAPRRRERPPTGDRWIHEVKFDGYRIQLKNDRKVVLFSKGGHHFTSRFPTIAHVARRCRLALRSLTAISSPPRILGRQLLQAPRVPR